MTDYGLGNAQYQRDMDEGPCPFVDERTSPDDDVPDFSKALKWS